MIVVEKIDIRNNLINSETEKQVEKFAKEKYGITDLNAIRKAFEDWKANRKPDWDIKDANQKDFVTMMKDPDILEQEFGKYFKDLGSKDSNEESEETSKDSNEESEEVNPNEQQFELKFRDLFYNKKGRPSSKSDREEAVKLLNNYIGTGKEILSGKNKLRMSFLSANYGNVYSYDKTAANNMIINYLSGQSKSQQAMGEVLYSSYGNDPKFIRNFVDGMSFTSLEDKDNVFMRLALDKTYKGIMSRGEDSFSKLFNMAAKYEGNQDFKDYSMEWSKPGDQVVLKNNDLYTKVKLPQDRDALIKYDLGLGKDPEKITGNEGKPISKRRILNDAITNGDEKAWKSYVLNQQNKDKEEKDGYKVDSKKSNNQIAKDFKKDLVGKSSDEIGSILKDWAKQSGIKDLSPIDSLIGDYIRNNKGK